MKKQTFIIKDVEKNIDKYLETLAKETEVISKALVMQRSENPTGYLANHIIAFENTVTAKTDYAVFVEEGTKYMEGKHYMEDAVEIVLRRHAHEKIFK